MIARSQYRKLAGMAVYCLFLAMVIEIALQTFYYATAGDFLFRRSSPPLYQSEPFAGYMNRPNLAFDHHTNEFRAHYFTNDQGFRVAGPGTEYALAKPANTYRIMLLGPSFAYGWGVDYGKSFANLLPRILTEKGFAPGRKIELIDAGIPAMPPASQLNWYAHVGKNYQPDLVIQFIYGSMAVTTDPHANYVADSEGHLVETDLTPAQRWREKAKQFATVFYGWLLWTDLDAWLHGKSDTEGNTVLGAGRQLTEEKVFEPSKPSVRDATAFYGNLAEAARESGARLQIVYFPLSYILYPQDESRWRHLGVRDVTAQEAFDANFVAYLNKRSIPAIDITPALRQAAVAPKRLYYWLDIHWTPEGNAAAARAVADYLVSANPQNLPAR